MRDPLHLLSRLHAGFRPGPAELARAAVIEDWQIMPTVGPFALTGRANREHIFAVLIALGTEAGWALLTDRWLKLGRGSGSLAPPDEIMRRAALWLREDAPLHGLSRPHGEERPKDASRTIGPPPSFETAASPPPQDEGGSGDTALEISMAARALAQRAERLESV